MRNIIALILCLFINNTAQTQNYWQQNADYKINVDVNANNNKYKGNQEIKYTNNSRDTLNKIFFHLYFNAFRVGSDMAVRLENGDDNNKRFDVIVSNPPYINTRNIKNLSEDIRRYEPRMALDGGNDGLDLIRKVIYKSNEILKINGTLALEIGNEQIKKVSKILINNNFRVKSTIKDYKNNIRCILANHI